MLGTMSRRFLLPLLCMLVIISSCPATGLLLQYDTSFVEGFFLSIDDPSLYPSTNFQVHLVQEQPSSVPLSNVTSWLCVYSDVSVDDILKTDYDLVDIDPDAFSHQGINTLRESGKIVIAYLSVGEAEDYRYYWDSEADYLLEENPDWPGCWYVDYTHPEWQRILINEYIPMIRSKGFDGLYLDTVETYHVEESYPNCTKDAMIAFVTAIAKNFRSTDFCIIMQNGLDIASELFDHIDGVAVEETYFRAVYCPILGWHINGIPQNPATRRDNEQRMREALDEGLVVFTLDYAVLPFQVIRCYTMSQAKGFIPYVSTAELNRIFPHSQ